MRLCIIAACVTIDPAAMPGIITARVPDLTAGLALIRADGCD